MTGTEEGEDAAAQARQAVLRLEQALVAAAEWNSDLVTGRELTTVIQAEPDSGESHSRDTGVITREAVDVPTSAEQRAGDRSETAPEVARFEQVMSVAPKVEPETAPEASVAPPAVEPVESVAPPVRESVPPPNARTAYWFELAPAPQQEQAAAVETSVAPPEPQAVSEPASQPAFEPASSGSANSWLTALCLVLLVALIVALTARKPSR